MGWLITRFTQLVWETALLLRLHFLQTCVLSTMRKDHREHGEKAQEKAVRGDAVEQPSELVSSQDSQPDRATTWSPEFLTSSAPFYYLSPHILVNKCLLDKHVGTSWITTTPSSEASP